MTNTELNYVGKVVLKLRINGEDFILRSKNKGTNYLKKSICKFLTGNYGGEVDIPQMLDLRIYDEANERWKSFLNQQIELTGKTYQYIDDDKELGIRDNWVARFEGAIPYAALLDPIRIGDEGSYRLYLYGAFDTEDIKERYHDLAYIPVSVESLARITPGTQALVEWNMQILNPGEGITTYPVIYTDVY